MATYGYKLYRDESERKFPKLISAMGYEGAKIWSESLGNSDGRPRLEQLLSMLKVGDVLVIEELSDICKVPSELPELLGKLSASPATVYVAELSRHAPVETYANILSLSAVHFAKLEKDIASLEEQLATTNARVNDYVQACSAKIAEHFHQMYQGTPRGLIEGLLTPPVDLTKEEPLAPVVPIVEVLERCRRKHGFTFQDLSALTGHAVSTIHRCFQTGRGNQLGDLIDILTMPRGPAPKLPPREPEKAGNGRAPIDESWKPGPRVVAGIKPGIDEGWKELKSEEEEAV